MLARHWKIKIFCSWFHGKFLTCVHGMFCDCEKVRFSAFSIFSENSTFQGCGVQTTWPKNTHGYQMKDEIHVFHSTPIFLNSATGEHTIALRKSDPSKCSLLSWVILAVLVKGWGISTANAKHQEIASNIFLKSQWKDLVSLHKKSRL